MTWRPPTKEQERRAPLVNGHSFREALGFALGSVEPHGAGADPGPLADYVASDVPLTRNHRLILADFIRMLPVRKLPGNPLDAPNLEVRAAAKRIDQAKQDWLAQHPHRKNVPMRVEHRAINTIVVGERIRVDLGDIEELAESMRERLLHPITITDDGKLLAGAQALSGGAPPWLDHDSRLHR